MIKKFDVSVVFRRDLYTFEETYGTDTDEIVKQMRNAANPDVILASLNLSVPRKRKREDADADAITDIEVQKCDKPLKNLTEKEMIRFASTRESQRILPREKLAMMDRIMDDECMRLHETTKKGEDAIFFILKFKINVNELDDESQDTVWEMSDAYDNDVDTDEYVEGFGTFVPGCYLYDFEIKPVRTGGRKKRTRRKYRHGKKTLRKRR